MKNTRLLQLLAQNRAEAQRHPLAVRQLAGDEAEVRIYAPIVDDAMEAEYWGGVAPEPFIDQLNAITAGTIHLRINSPGGSVFGARAMETALREHKARVVVHIDSLAASAASFLAMAGDEIVMSPGAMVMIHNAWTFAMGNAADLEKTAALLKKIDGTLVDTYAARTQQGADEIAAWMAAETWFTAAEAVQHGFADSVAEAAKPGSDAAARAAWNLSAYSRAPNSGLLLPAGQVEPPAPAPPAPSPTRRVDAAALLRALDVAVLTA